MHGDVFFAVASVLVAVLIISSDWSTKRTDEWTQEPHMRLLSRDELSLYDGARGSKGLYLAIIGQVFDVQKGDRHYGVNGGYHGMAGRLSDFYLPPFTKDNICFISYIMLCW